MSLVGRDKCCEQWLVSKIQGKEKSSNQHVSKIPDISKLVLELSNTPTVVGRTKPDDFDVSDIAQNYAFQSECTGPHKKRA